MTRTDSRFRAVEVPTLAPGECHICKSVSRGPFVDTGISDNWSGHILYICFGCLSDMATDVDYAWAPNEVAPEPEPETDSEAFKRGWKAAINAVSEDLNGLVNHYAVHPGDDPDPVSDLTLFEFEGISADSEGQEGSGTSADGAIKQDRSPSKRKGPTSVSSDSGDGSEFPDYA